MLRGVVALLIVSCWHAPIPWVHAHDLRGPGVDRQAGLYQHVSEFHASQLTFGADHLDLHAHLVLPWGMEQQAPHRHQPQEPSAQTLFAMKFGGTPTSTWTQTIGQPLDLAWGQAPSLDQAGVASAAAIDGSPVFTMPRGGHFFDTFAGSVSIRDLIRVRLC